ncbi:hypothetical protein CYMTET_23264 [Cymbomonas tetramitiformis]|uniref:Uncharacterized protein n=1 Tax=Cymbomonas tetramitiformis TaxID=36881 RepID=A0AAE0FZ02_9CHLO|nr:hypothetical protein CYMTET_23264 [Cymbomonas tetramitiformis]
MWSVTDSHPDTRGACPYVCIKPSPMTNIFPCPSRLLPVRRSARPPLQAALRTSPPADDSLAPPPNEADAAFHSVRFSVPTPGGAAVIDTSDAANLVVPEPSPVSPPQQDAYAAFALCDDEEEGYPDFRVDHQSRNHLSRRAVPLPAIARKPRIVYHRQRM